MLFRFVLLTLLIVNSFAQRGPILDIFRPHRTSEDSDKFDNVLQGHCASSGCTSGKTQPRFCFPPIYVYNSTHVKDKRGTNFERGVKNCAKACRDEGIREDEDEWGVYPGQYVCNSFDYRPLQKTTSFYYENHRGY